MVKKKRLTNEGNLSLISANMKARCGTSQVLAGLYCMLLQFGFFYSWHLFLEFRAGRTATVLWITVGMFTRSWCHLVWSLVVTKWSTQTLLSQCSLDNKVSPQGLGLEALKCCGRCFHTFSHSNFPSSYTNTHTHTPLAQLFYPIRCWKLQYKNSDVIMLAWQRLSGNHPEYFVNHLATP